MDDLSGFFDDTAQQQQPAAAAQSGGDAGKDDFVDLGVANPYDTTADTTNDTQEVTQDAVVQDDPFASMVAEENKNEVEEAVDEKNDEAGANAPKDQSQDEPTFLRYSFHIP